MATTLEYVSQLPKDRKKELTTLKACHQKTVASEAVLVATTNILITEKPI